MGQPELTKIDDFDSVFGDELEAGHTLMHGQYTIKEFLNAGGFGITYLAKDSLDRTVVIKECFPGSLCRRTTTSVQARSRAHTMELSSIVRLFVEEARSLARLDHPNIVGVHQVFEENNTAYMALDYVEGRDLLDMIEKPEDILEPEQVETILRKLLGAVGFIHDQGILHRDISPDNVLIQPNMEPILIDFGAAREEAGKKSRILSAMRVVKDGYSPQEFYISGAEQGQFSDLYALGATFYHLITGELPANSQSRLAAVASGGADPYVPVFDRQPEYSDAFLKGIDKALEILPKDRISSAAHWLDLLDGKAAVDTTGKASAVSSKAAAASAEPSSRKRNAALLLGTVAVLAPILVGISYTQSGTPQPNTEVAIAATSAQPAETTVAVSAPVEEASNDAVATAGSDLLAVLTSPVEPSAPSPTSVSAEDSLSMLLAAPTEQVVVETAPAVDVMVDVPTSAVAPTVADVPTLIAVPTVVDVPAPTADATAPAVPTVVEDPVVDVAWPPAAAPSQSDAVIAPEPTAQSSWVGSTDQPSLAPDTIQAAATTTSLPIIESFDLPQVVSNWSVDVDSKLQNPTDAMFEINGLAIDASSNIDVLLSENFTAPDGGETEVIVLTGAEKESSTYEVLTVPVVHRTTFANGMMVETRMIDGAWTTNVVSAPSGFDFQNGDVLVGDMATGTAFDTRTSFPDSLVSAHAENRSKLTLAVRRGEDVVPVDIAVPGKL